MKWKNIGLETKLLLLITIGTVLVMIGATMAITSTVRNQQIELAYDQSVITTRNYANQFDMEMHASMGFQSHCKCNETI